MSNNIYSRGELEFIDELLTFGESEGVGFENLRLENIKMLPWFNEQDFLQLRLKGVIDVSSLNIKESEIEGSLEKISVIEEEYISINDIQLIQSWLNTLFNLAGKNSIQEIDIKSKNGYLYSEVELDTELKIELKFIVSRRSSHTKGPFVSFTNSVKQDMYETLVYWDEPIASQTSAISYIQKLKEISKFLSNKNFNYINIPAHLESNELEGFKSVIKTYLENLGYKALNDSKHFRPESIDYSLPEEMIREVYAFEEQKIFILENEKRIEIHTFRNGLKKSNDLITYHVRKMKSLVEKKVDVYYTNVHRKNMNFLKDFKVLLAFILSVVLSVISSVKILFSSDLSTVIQSTWLLSVHVGLSVITIVFISFMGLYPQLRLYFFSWNRDVKNKVKKYKNEIK